MTMSSNSVVFNFNIAQIHKKMIVRARIYTECTGVNNTVKMTLAGTTNAVFNATPAAGVQDIVQGEVLHTGTTFTVTI